MAKQTPKYNRVDIKLQLTKPIAGTVQLTGSKSECNRAQIIAALSEGKVALDNFSDADDCVILKQCLEKAAAHVQAGNTQPCLLNVGPAGTAARFMAAYLCMVPGMFILDGTERMRQRPIGILINALRELGAEITCLKNEGFLPLTLEGGAHKIKQGSVEMDGSVSSQFITALMLVGWCLPGGLEIKITGKPTSTPYIAMTARLLQQCGMEVIMGGGVIKVAGKPLKTLISIEPDWSAASYWYGITALKTGAELHLPGLRKDSMQGDRRCAAIFEELGLVKTNFTNGGAKILHTNLQREPMVIDFTDTPDLAQAVIVACAAKGRTDTFTGLHTLRVKETDRILAMQRELEKFGAILHGSDEAGYTLGYAGNGMHEPDAPVNTYEDHRMAMAFAQLAVQFNICINDAGVVKKSYPAFWQDLSLVGFSLAEYGR